MFFYQLLIGIALICATVLIHAVIFDRILTYLEPLCRLLKRHFFIVWKMLTLIIVINFIFLALIIEIWLWAGFYLLVDALPDLETALYFSTSTFTTVGYGDIVLGESWRLISSFQSANGFLLFGWSTAFMFEIIQKIYDKKK